MTLAMLVKLSSAPIRIMGKGREEGKIGGGGGRLILVMKP